MKKLITMLSTLIITSSITNLAVACNWKWNKESNAQKKPTVQQLTIDINKITAKEIINMQSEYKGINDQNEKVTVTPNKLGSLKNNYIEFLLRMNLTLMFMKKIFGTDKTIFTNPRNKNFSDIESQGLLQYTFFEICAISFDAKSKENSKIFTVTIKINDEDKAFEDRITMKQKVEDYFSYNEIEKAILSCIWDLTITQVEVNNEHNSNSFKRLTEHDKFDLYKLYYKCIKGQTATIEIDLTDKQ